jgi:hypothetical protein
MKVAQDCLWTCPYASFLWLLCWCCLHTPFFPLSVLRPCTCSCMTTPRRSGRLAKPESDVESGLPVLVSTSVKKKAATLVKAGKSTAPAPNKSDVPKHQSVPKSTSLKKAQKRARSGTTTSHSGSRKPGKKAKTTATLDESWKHKGKMKKSAGEHAPGTDGGNRC